jgi:outer membrane protein insertion porin family
VDVLDSQLMRMSGGIGIQWISPFGPIRVDYAIPIQKEYWDKTENFRFSFGTRF